MRSGERVAGVFQVIELRVDPTIHGVARGAGRRKLEAGVIENRGEEVVLMAGIAICRKALELTGGGVLVALFALNQRVCAYKWKAVLVIAYCFQGNVPPLHGVATFAIGTELSAMNVGVAISASFTYVLENEAGVALGASNLLVHAAQGVAGLVVIEFRIGSDGLPTGVGVTVLARYGDWPMGIRNLGLRSDRGRRRMVIGCLDRHDSEERQHRNERWNVPA